MTPNIRFVKQQNLEENIRQINKYVKYFPISESDTLIKPLFSQSSGAPPSPCTRTWPLWPQAVQTQLEDTPSSFLRSLKLNETHRYRIHVNGIKNSKADLNSSQANKVCVALLWRRHRKRKYRQEAFQKRFFQRVYYNLSLQLGSHSYKKDLNLTISEFVYKAKWTNIFPQQHK